MPHSSDDRFSKAANAFLSNVWGDRAIGMDVSAIDWGKVNHSDILYLLYLYPFVQMISSNPVWEATIIPHFRKAPSGWLMHDYGQALSCSPGKYLFGAGNPEISEEDSESGSGRGTIVKQTVITAEAMVRWAMEKGWPGLEIVAGTDLMKWAIWMAAQDRNFLVLGYVPTPQDQEKRERIRRLKSENPGISTGLEPSSG